MPVAQGHDRDAEGQFACGCAAELMEAFVEVKARKSIEVAAASISPKQWQRIMTSAQIYVSDAGLPVNTDLRFDAALIDQAGNCEIVENAPVF